MPEGEKQYCHTQRAPLHLLLHAVSLACLTGAWLSRDTWPAALILVGVAAMMSFLALMFARMTVRDEGEQLAIRFGPLPVFSHRLRYEDITSVQAGRSAVIDGWGIHWIPWRGWTFNLWGFRCALLRVKGGIVRIGSDDVDNLVAFLRRQIRQEGEPAGGHPHG